MGNADNGHAATTRERRLPRLRAWPEDMERLMNRSMRGLWPGRLLTRPSLLRETAWVPDMDVFEREGKTVIRVDAPGVRREDLETVVEGDMLVIRGRREEEKEVTEENYFCSERASGSFSRAMTLPEGVRAEDIEATYQDGVVEVVLPKPAAEEKQTTKIEIK